MYTRTFEHWTEVLSFLGDFTKLRKSAVSFVVSVRPSAWNISAQNGQTFMKFDI
jgi:hypothetical protein